MDASSVKNITDLDISELLEQLQKGKLTALEVLRAYQIKVYMYCFQKPVFKSCLLLHALRSALVIAEDGISY